MRQLGAKTFFVRAGLVGMGSMILLVALASPASAQDAISESTQALLDNFWVLLAGFLVFLMQAGFAFVEAGLTRAKNIANIMAKNLADMCIGALAFFAVGYGIAFGNDGASLIGLDSWFLSGSNSDISSGLSTYTEFFFQVVFAATAVTIASGAMAERTKFQGYLIFSAVMTAFIYPMVVHAGWHGDGLLSDLAIGDARFTDFAGSTIVHSTGGWAALMGAIFLGPRLGRFGSHGPQAIPGHNVGFTVLGVFILWFGWFGFNPGSELALNSVVAHAALTTLLAAAAGGIVAGFVIWKHSGAVEVAMVGNGVLAGLVSITAGTATMNPMGALITGAIGGVLVVYSVFFFDRIRIDDPVGAISVHGICGAWGTLAVGLFATVGADPRGLFYGGGFSLLGVQAIGILIVFGWVVLTSGIVFFVMKKLNLLRISKGDELKGLDISEHGSSGYGLEMDHHTP